MGNRILPGAVAAVLVVVLAFTSGGYFASEWGLVTLALALGAIAVLLVADELRVGPLDVLVLGALGLLGVWQLLTILWSTGAGVPVLEAERTLVYLCAAAVLVLFLEPSRVPSCSPGLSPVTIVAVYALGTRPPGDDGRRLRPVLRQLQLVGY
jgi:peptidoglycan/LPS O-acetylase OafA/YrhL